jgi:hypothetical protein
MHTIIVAYHVDATATYVKRYLIKVKRYFTLEHVTNAQRGVDV